MFDIYWQGYQQTEIGAGLSFSRAGSRAGHCMITRVAAVIKPNTTQVFGITKESKVRAESEKASSPHRLAVPL